MDPFSKRLLKPLKQIYGTCFGEENIVLCEFIVLKMLWYYMSTFNTGKLLVTMRCITLTHESRIWIEI